MPAPSRYMTKKPPVEFTPERKQKFLEHYRKNGLQYLAAEAVGVAPETVTEHKRRDPVFKELCDAAKEAHTDELIASAMTRGVEGVTEPIIGGKDRNQIVAHKRVYSDRLLELLLKSRREEFRNNVQVDASVSGGVLVVPGQSGGTGEDGKPAKPMSPEEWQEKYGQASKAQADQKDTE